MLSHDLAVFLLGVCAIPAMMVLAALVGILRRATRDAVKRIRLGLMPGYSRLRWAYLAPMIWWDMIKQQCWSWWHGIETEVTYYRR
jgi:hypothetical protein